MFHERVERWEAGWDSKRNRDIYGKEKVIYKGDFAGRRKADWRESWATHGLDAHVLI